MTDELLVRLGRLEGTQDLILVTVKELRGDLNGKLSDMERRLDVLETFKTRISVLATLVTTAAAGLGLFASDLFHYFIGKH